jgi:hypothetical protein
MQKNTAKETIGPLYAIYKAYHTTAVRGAKILQRAQGQGALQPRCVGAGWVGRWMGPKYYDSQISHGLADAC